jgi:hypothetical protein
MKKQAEIAQMRAEEERQYQAALKRIAEKMAAEETLELHEAVRLAMTLLGRIASETDDLRIVVELVGKPLGTRRPLSEEYHSPVDWWRTDPHGFLKFAERIIDAHMANIERATGKRIADSSRRFNEKAFLRWLKQPIWNR